MKNYIKERYQNLYVNMTADHAMDALGKPHKITETGTDENGKIVTWEYPGLVLTIKRFALRGIIAYRIAEITMED